MPTLYFFRFRFIPGQTVRHNDVFALDLTTLTETQITDNPRNDGNFYDSSGFRFSDSAQEVLLLEGFGAPPAQYALFRAPPNDPNSRTPVTPNTLDIGSADWCDGDQTVVYTAWNSDGQSTALKKITLANSQEQDLRNDGGVSDSVSVSPDGTKISYLYRTTYSSPAVIVVASSDGSSPQTYPTTDASGNPIAGWQGSPRWSPDGTKLVYTLMKNPGFDLNILEIATGTHTTLIGDSAIPIHHPIWADQSIYLGQGADNARSLYSIDAVTGGNLTQLTSIPDCNDTALDYRP